ncbi:hypothetical protein AAG570_013212 [Ranatra chinensis]|uniref:Uncharacterized protein n=1 Tax=Ranatra chinensis TaxID=642074 RepID=A0ABD0Z4E0_9HEMI
MDPPSGCMGSPQIVKPEFVETIGMNIHDRDVHLLIFGTNFLFHHGLFIDIQKHCLVYLEAKRTATSNKVAEGTPTVYTIPADFLPHRLTATHLTSERSGNIAPTLQRAICHLPGGPSLPAATGGTFRLVFRILTDHMPLTFVFQQPHLNAPTRRTHQLTFISQFTTDIRFLARFDNHVKDALSGLRSSVCPTPWTPLLKRRSPRNASFHDYFGTMEKSSGYAYRGHPMARCATLRWEHPACTLRWNSGNPTSQKTTLPGLTLPGNT